MPKHQIFLSAAFLTLLLYSSGCGKNEDIFRTEEEPHPIPVELIQASISGVIQSTDGAFIDNAQIRIYQTEADSDKNGYFQMEGLIPKNGAFLRVQKQGFFNGYSLVAARNKATTFLPLQLAPLENSFQFDNMEGFNWTSPEGIILRIPPMGVIQPDGIPAGGQVSLSIRWISPEVPLADLSHLQILRGIDPTEAEVALRHAGVLQMDIRHPGGSDLEIEVAHLEIPINQLQQNQDIVSELELWQLDHNGFWRKAGNLESDGLTITTPISGSTLWSLGAPRPLQNVDGLLLYRSTEGGSTPLPFQLFKLVPEAETFTHLDFVTDDRGRYTLYLPEDANYRVQLPDQCGQPMIIDGPTHWVPPTTLGSIDVSSGGIPLWEEKRFVDCEGNPVLEGYLYIKTGQSTAQIVPLQPADSGRAHVPVCLPETVSFELFDQREMTRWPDLPVYPFLEDAQGVISLCDTFSAFFEVTLNGQEHHFSNCQAFLVKDNQDPEKRVMHVVAFSAPFTSHSDFVDLWIGGDQPGKLALQSMTFRINAFHPEIIQAQVAEMQATIDRVGKVNEGIRGDIRGSMIVNDLGTIELTAQFHALRLN